MEQFKAPSPLSLTANPADNWCSWEQNVRRYIAASGEKDEQGKIDILVQTIGEGELEVLNVLPERLHIKEEPEMLSEGQEEKQLCVQQETNSAACCVKCEDEEEKPQTSQLHWRQVTEMNMKQEPSTCTLKDLMKIRTEGINSEAVQNPDQSSLVLQDPEGTETDSSQTEDSNEDDDNDDEEDNCWQKPTSQSETEAEFDSIRKKASLSSASKLKINSREKLFECDVCGKCFIRKVQLKSHMRTHTGEKTFKCDVCRKCFFRKEHMQLHTRIHTGEKPFRCAVCSKCFTRKHHLQLHVRIHSGEKPFKCDVCSKCFFQKSDLNKHTRIHTGEKPHQCDFCSKGFTSKANLTQHMRIHTGEKPFKCNICSKSYIQKCQLQSHMRSHIGDNVLSKY